MRRSRGSIVLFRLAAVLLLAGIGMDVLGAPCELPRGSARGAVISTPHEADHDLCSDCGAAADCFCCARPTTPLSAITVSLVASERLLIYPPTRPGLTAGVLPLPYHPPLSRI